MKYYTEDTAEVLKAMESTEIGLTAEEAQKRLLQHGQNKLAEGKKITMLQRFFAQMKDPMTIILLVAAVVSAITAAYSGESFADVIIIMAVV
ncbi:MAG: cation-transporting P-type ATPase, partial [Ruthenibacterium sp.]